MLGLLSNEALDDMLLERALSVDSLNEAYHGLVALRVEGGVGACLDLAERIGSVFDWVLADAVQDVVSKVGDESEAVAQLNFHCLVIDRRPGAGVALAAV